MEPNEREHDAECLAPRCPYCGSRDLEFITRSREYLCRECTFFEESSWFEGPHTECICAELAAARAELGIE